MLAEPNLTWIYRNAIFFGIPYAIAGVLCGWSFVRRIAPEKTLRTIFLASCCCHLVSTIAVFWALPALVFLSITSTQSWQLAGIISVLSGIPGALCDYLLLRWVFRFDIKARQLRLLLLWKAVTLGIFGCFGVMYVVGFIVWNNLDPM